MFKNLIVYRIGEGWSASASQLEAELDKARFVPCGLTQQKSSGWIEPRGEKHGPLVEAIGGQWVLRLMTEQRVVPGSVVKRRTDEIADQIEEQTGRRPGKKQTKELKEQALLELLPMAFTKVATSWVWIAPKQRLLVLDCGSQAKADEIVTLLVKAMDDLALSLIQTEMSPAVAMSHWLGTGEPPYQFSVDRECELKSPDEMKSVVRYARHPLDTDEVKQHIQAGKVPTRVALSWRERVSFVLTEALQLKKLAFLDVVFESEGTPSRGGKVDPSEAFEADVAISTGELIQLIPDLLEALGGEALSMGLVGTLKPQDLSGDRPGAVSTTAAPAASPMALHPGADHAPPWDA
ncbi:recombination-associated protein RdgC [Aquabacterium sp. UBA2148]|uniref:recombination-associated protein RdgC n=1 Tax=Aquabacterium sp. UBA2148 TaxID=1946042 RepID=UPI0025796631|nr:recombination-associated protein RdgC [Aquabacterium sp. UBA2148]